MLLLGLGVGSCTRGLGSGSQRDGGTTDGRIIDPPQGDATVTMDPCAPMEAQLPPNVRCGDPTPIGWMWNGEACHGIPCACEGADCDRLYATESHCLQARAPACLPPPRCLGLNYEECEARQDCEVEYFGGGCMNLDDCEPGGPGEGQWICWERGIVCLPVGDPCNERSREECHGECYWWERTMEHCFAGLDAPDCCITESYGVCTPLLPEEPDCEAQRVNGCSDPCVSVVGYFWDGSFCSPIRCCCEGPDCGSTYATLQACLDARGGCLDNACAEAGGVCEYGDFVMPTCAPEYGTDFSITEANPGTCGLGVCCTPCPDPSLPGVSYVGQSPAECADIDFDCFDLARHFDNECGCGCIAFE